MKFSNIRLINDKCLVKIYCALHTPLDNSCTATRALDMCSTTIASLLTAPPYPMTAFTAMSVAWNSNRLKERGWLITEPMIITVVGYIISVATLNPAARHTASFLYISGSFSACPLVITWAVSTLGRAPEKRAARNAVVNVMCSLATSSRHFSSRLRASLGI